MSTGKSSEVSLSTLTKVQPTYAGFVISTVLVVHDGMTTLSTDMNGLCFRHLDDTWLKNVGLTMICSRSSRLIFNLNCLWSIQPDNFSFLGDFVLTGQLVIKKSNFFSSFKTAVPRNLVKVSLTRLVDKP